MLVLTIVKFLNGSVYENYILLTVLLLSIGLCFRTVAGWPVGREELYLVRNFGVQLRTFNISGHISCEKFIDYGRIRDFIVNESMSYVKLDMYLAFLVDTELTVVFDQSQLSQPELL